MDKEILQLQEKWGLKFDGEEREFLDSVIEQTYKQGEDNGHRKGQKDLMDDIERELYYLEERIKDSGGSKYEIQEAFSNFRFHLIGVIENK